MEGCKIIWDRSPQPPGANAWWFKVELVYVIIIEIKCTVIIMCMNHPETTPSHAWKNYLPWNSPGQNTFPSPGDLPIPGFEPRSPTLQVDSLPAEPQEKPKNTGVGSLSLLQRIFPTQELRTGISFTNWAMREAHGVGQIGEIPVMGQSIEAANSSK